MQPDSRDTGPPNPIVTGIVFLLAAILWIVIAAEMLFVVPEFERIFVDFHMRLPLATEAIIACSRWCVKYWYVLAMQMAMAAGGMAALTWLIRHRVRKNWLSSLWCLAMLLVPAAIAFLTWLACYLPMEKLLDGLAGQKG
jgi:type II secretory pathway component PulF